MPRAPSPPTGLRRLGLLAVAVMVVAPAVPAGAAGAGNGNGAGGAPTVASVFGKGHDPDMPGGVDPTAYLAARDAYFNARAGDPFVGGHGNLRVAGIKKLSAQRHQQLVQASPSGVAPGAAAAGATALVAPVAPVATAAWSPLGPSPLPNGQTQTVSSAVSGRATSIAIDPTNKNIVYVGSAGGGVFRTLDGGVTWTAIADGMQVMAVGALAVAPSDPSVLYVGTGETNLSLDSYAGVGLYRIDNANAANGPTPTLSGPINPAVTPVLDDGHAFTAQGISRILVSPADAGSVLVSTHYGGLGKYGTSRATSSATTSIRGIWRSTNANGPAGSVAFTSINGGAGGLGIDAGVSDMELDPHDPTTLVAGVINSSNGAASQGLWRGTNVWVTPTWTHTLSPPGGTNSVWRIAASGATGLGGATTTFYAGNDQGTGVVRMSTDGGATWSSGLPAFGGHCGGQCWYDDPIGVSPTNAGLVLAGGDGGSPLRKSTDFGQNQVGTVDTGLHADAHAIAFAPSDSSTVWIANDGGVFRSSDAGSTWTSANTAGLDSLQFQSLAVHPTDPTFSIGGTQDNGTEWLRTNGSWTRADFGDGGASAIDQSATSTTAVTMYHTYFNIQNSQIGFARVTNTSNAQDGFWAAFGCGGGLTANGIGCGDATQFYAPLALGPGSPNTVYFGTDRLYRSTNQGATMTVVSSSPAKALMSGATLTSIGISPTTDNSRIVGLSNGHVWATTAGTTLTDVTPSSAGWPLTVGQAQPVVVDDTKIDPANPTTAFVGLGNYFGSPTAHLWRTTTLGGANTWTAATGLPDVPVNAITIDPSNDRFVYAGTDIGVYYSTDRGATFAPLGTGLPAVAVFDLQVVQPGTAGGTLRIATHGRGVWQFPIGDAAAPSTITLSPTNPSVAAGDPQSFVATAHYDDGSTADVTSRATWSSSATSVATVTVTGGVATTKAQGVTTITAAFHGVDGTTALTVTPAVLRALAVTPAPSVSVGRGQSTKLTATGTFSDGSHPDVSDTVTWASDAPSTADVDTHGLVTANAVGSATISASTGAFLSSTTVTVTPAVITSIAVSPATPSVPKGDTQPFTASASSSDGAVTDVTSQATWSSGSTAVATMSGATAGAVGTGTSTITATVGGVSGNATLTVTPAVLRSISVTPVSVSVAQGLSTQLTAIGTFSDASTQNLTQTVTWQSGAPSTATVDSFGLVTGAGQGLATVTATIGALSSHSDVTVTAPVVTAVTVSPLSTSVPKGDARQFTATATWSAGSPTDVTNAATWSSSTSAATVDVHGLAHGAAPGAAGISATYAGTFGTATLTVTAPVLRSLVVTPSTSTVMPGRTKQYVATGTFSDGSTRTVSSTVQWSTGNLKVAKVGATGLVTGVAFGSTTVRAGSGTIAAKNVTVNVTHRAPKITAVSPMRGKVGTIVTITGRNFVTRPAMVVKFGTTRATSVTVVSATKLRVKVPRGARSAVISVQNDGGTARSTATFHVLP